MCFAPCKDPNYNFMTVVLMLYHPSHTVSWPAFDYTEDMFTSAPLLTAVCYYRWQKKLKRKRFTSKF